MKTVLPKICFPVYFWVIEFNYCLKCGKTLLIWTAFGITKLQKYTLFIYLFKRFYLFIHERHRDRERDRDTGRGRRGSMQEPDVGFDPGTPGSRPRLKASTNY